MKLSKITIVLAVFMLCGCVTVTKKSNFDSYQADLLSKPEVLNEITLREHKIDQLQQKIQTLKNYNDKFKTQIDFDKSFNKDTDMLTRTLAKNIEMINRIAIEIAKLNLELRVLNRRKDLF